MGWLTPILVLMLAGATGVQAAQPRHAARAALPPGSFASAPGIPMPGAPVPILCPAPADTLADQHRCSRREVYAHTLKGGPGASLTLPGGAP
jgi:hypothetical protein